MITAAAPRSPNEPHNWWETRWFVAAMICLAFVPLLYPAIPPLVDLPGHMGRFRVELDLAHSPDLQRYYTFKWALIGNLGVDLLIIPMAKIFGLELGIKLIVMTIPPLTVAGFLWVAREVHNRIPPTALFALPFAFSHPFLFGFVNFSLSMALAFLAFGLWLRLARLDRTRLRGWLFVPISFVIFVTHAFGWGALGMLCFSAEAVRQHDRGISWWRAGLHAAAQASVMALPILLMLLWRTGSAGSLAHDWFDFSSKFYYIRSALRDRWDLFDHTSIAVVFVMLIITLARRELGFSRNLGFSAFVLSLCFVCLPRILFGSAYADMRLAPFIFAVALIAIRFRGQTPLRFARMLAAIGLTFYVARLAATSISLALAANQQQRALGAIDHLPIGARVLSLVGTPCGEDWALSRMSHLGGIAIARRNAFENDQWNVAGANLLQVRNPGQYGGFAADPSQIVVSMSCQSREYHGIDMVIAAFPRASFDYLWLIEPPAHDPRGLAGMTRVWSAGASALYRVAPAGKVAPSGENAISAG